MPKKKITIHQPEFLPWLGFFDKISQADLYVVLDNVQFEKNYFQNRNKIRISNGWTYISVPIDKSTLTKNIKDVKIAYLPKWKQKAEKTITQNYRKAAFFEQFAPDLFNILHKNQAFLMSLNIEIIQFLFSAVKIKTPLIFASDISNTNLKSTNLLLDICKNTGADIYLSGPSGRDYLETEKFSEIALKFHSFTHPTYQQQFADFLPYMSGIDLLFNYGADNFMKIVKKGRMQNE